MDLLSLIELSSIKHVKCLWQKIQQTTRYLLTTEWKRTVCSQIKISNAFGQVSTIPHSWTCAITRRALSVFKVREVCAWVCSPGTKVLYCGDVEFINSTVATE